MANLGARGRGAVLRQISATGASAIRSIRMLRYQLDDFEMASVCNPYSDAAKGRDWGRY